MKRLWKENGSRQEESARRLSASADIAGKELLLSKILFFLKKEGEDPYCIKEHVLLFSTDQSRICFPVFIREGREYLYFSEALP